MDVCDNSLLGVHFSHSLEHPKLFPGSVPSAPQLPLSYSWLHIFLQSWLRGRRRLLDSITVETPFLKHTHGFSQSIHVVCFLHCTQYHLSSVSYSVSLFHQIVRSKRSETKTVKSQILWPFPNSEPGAQRRGFNKYL